VNIFASLQRALLFEEIVSDLSKRLVRYESMSKTSAMGCGRVLTAVDQEGTLLGFLDLSLTLYDTVSNEFLVSEGPGLTLPHPGMERRAYIANLAVCKEARRQGVAEKLLHKVLLQFPFVHSAALANAAFIVLLFTLLHLQVQHLLSYFSPQSSIFLLKVLPFSVNSSCSYLRSAPLTRTHSYR